MKSKFTDTNIPKRFIQGKVVCKTVGDLKKELFYLPDDLPIDEDYQQVVVPNVGHESEASVIALHFSDGGW